MNRPEWRLVLAAALAVLVPAVVLDSAAGEARCAAELTAAPFAWRRLLIAHLVAALPLGFAVAGWVRAASPLARVPGWAWAVLGPVAAAAGAALAASQGEAAVRAGLGGVGLLLLRAAVAFLLVLPWCVAATPEVSPAAPPDPDAPQPGWLALVVGVGLAVLPCGLFADAVTAARTDEAARLIGQQRLARAEWVVIGLWELGSERPVLKRTPAETRDWLTGYLRSVRREVDVPLPAAATPQQRVERAVRLTQLERLGDAADVLAPAAPGDEAATLMLAAVYRNLERPAESEHLYRAVIRDRLPAAGSDPAARAACRVAFEGLAESARAAGRPADAEAALDRGLHELPADAAYFHLLLGRHYHDVGRVHLALDHLHAAARPQAGPVRAQAEDLIRQIRTATPGCLTPTPP